MTLRTASATISSSRQTIMAFVNFSTPFCKPRLHTPKPSTTATIIQNICGPGCASMSLKMPPTASADAPVNAPRSIFTT